MLTIDYTIDDSSKLNAGRIYYYLIGAGYNFPIDREMGDNFKIKAPFLQSLLLFIRWLLHVAIRKAGEEWKFTQFLDFASGIPLQDHIHYKTPPGTKVIYSDIDPFVVDVGRNIIGENPVVRYETCDAATPEKLLKSDIVKNLFKDNHKAAIGYNGILWFLSDEQISHAMKVLYDWADKGSILYLTDSSTKNPSDALKEFMQIEYAFLYEN